MSENLNNINRRNFLKTVGAAGLGSAFIGSQSKAGPNEPNEAKSEQGRKTQKPEQPQIPHRLLGKTGLQVPALALGGGVDFTENQVILRVALRWGITYWDTANSYAGGNSELGIGKFLAQNPEVRKDLFIVTKASQARLEPTPKAVVEVVEKRLQTSFKRLNTDYIDLYYGVHGMPDPSHLDDELRKWAESAKKRKLIKYFGFSTHKNMADNLMAASKLDWIDAIMTTYNFRLMQDSKMQEAIQACHEAGIGLIAMKVQARKQEVETDADKELVAEFLKRDFTEAQAKLKVVLEDKRFTAACVKMATIDILTSCVAAVLDQTKLSRSDKHLLGEYAGQTCSGYCASCADICDRVLPEAPYVSDVMRSVMYYNGYGEPESARHTFAQIPADVRRKLLKIDYSAAEAACPQHMPIGKIVREAVTRLA